MMTGTPFLSCRGVGVGKEVGGRGRVGICTERNREAALFHRQALGTHTHTHTPQAVQPSLVSRSRK